MKRLWTLLLPLALLLCGTAQAEVAVPKLTQRVTDLTATLDAEQVQALEARLAAFEKQKGSQIAVLMLPTTQPDTIEQFGIRVTDKWKLGRKGVDDGVLLLIAKDDHKLRIEVGYGLEGALNDATAKRIVSEIITPYFKQGEFYAGIDAGASAIIKVVEGEPLPPPSATEPAPSSTESPPSLTESEQGSDSDGLSNVFGLAFIIFMLGNIILRQTLARLPSGLIVGSLIGGLVWVTMLSLVAAFAAGIVAFGLSLLLGMGGGNSSFFGGWGGGGGSWSSSSDSDSGGSDFSGGGGDFGGGGASGDW